MLGAEEVQAEAARLQRDLRVLCSALDPDAVPLPEVSPLWSRFDALERLAAGAKLRLARRAEESASWRDKGARSPAEHQAQLAGTTTGRARAALATSKRLADLAAADEAVANGELSERQAEAIAEAASADPSAEARLLALAKGGDLRKLREECARVQARAEDDAKRAERLVAQRCLRTWRGSDGSWNLMAKHTPEMGAQFEAALAPLKEAIFQAARLGGHHESNEAYAADALAEMARRSVAAEDPVVPGDGQASTARGDDEQAEADEGAADEGAADEGGADEGAAGARRAPRSRRPDTKVIVTISYEARAPRGATQPGGMKGPSPACHSRSLKLEAA